ncbi:class I SAM-dependent methyltransferase [Methylomicrobium sp. RS1]|uniref:class I SAM-dependent methyltransferase n=1 Tax=Candidatus Methylomicrobium oryzae TaxID=2802053 RepID=UPI001923DBC8|nr:class I SAM-dependent methyltransferase [Methylomicrobium sp. RS1]MBL1264947.1 class I SAM-dependent methyltransferase [Methylomicrobium sp. RS1]
MLSVPFLKVILREIFSSGRVERITEPDLVMDDPEKVLAYTRAGREDGVMAPVYLFHAAHVCDLINPGETVVDLACGPATQLGLIARLNPEINFIGVDLSQPMLDKADAYINEQKLLNVKTVKDNIAELAKFEDNSVDAVFSTMALHHLPDQSALKETFSAIKRILKPGGGVYLADFARLKSAKSINYFAYQYADRQPELFTLDYYYSLNAAFSLRDFNEAKKQLPTHVNFYKLFLLPFMVAFKSNPRRQCIPDSLMNTLRNIENQLPGHHKVDIKDLKETFRLGGLKTDLLQ